jgi:Mrp family chromosome partitioning ATPase
VLAFSPYTDALLLVVEEGKTKAEEVERSLALVNNSCPVLGAVMNRAGQMAATPASMRKLLRQ